MKHFFTNGFIVLLSFFFVSILNVSAEEFFLDAQHFNSSGRHETILHIKHLGRYSVQANSKEGVQIEIVDRMAGSLGIDGDPGFSNGRLDLFLDKGEYKLIVIGDPNATGQVSLKAIPFLETQKDPTRLDEFIVDQTELDDFQQKSYWIKLKKPKWIYLEAAGKNLKDLRIWNGSWMTGDKPEIEIIEPVKGQPMTCCRISTQLSEGLHRITVYGGNGLKWAVNSKSSTMLIRYGIPVLGSAGQYAQTISSFGIDRYLVSSSCNYYNLRLNENQPASLRVQTFSDITAFQTSGSVSFIKKNARSPETELFYDNDASNRQNLVTITAEPETKYNLIHFPNNQYYWEMESDNYMLTSLHSGNALDNFDVTAILVWYDKPKNKASIDRTQAIPLNSKDYYYRRANIRGKTTLFLDIGVAGKYSVIIRHLNAQVRIEPFLIYPPKEYKPPAFKYGSSNWDLDPGYYIMTIQPQEIGILELAVFNSANTEFSFEKADIGLFPETPKISSVFFPKIAMDRKYSYHLFFNERYGLYSGVMFQPWPLLIQNSLPVAVVPSQANDLTIKVTEPGDLTLLNSAFEKQALIIDGNLGQPHISAGIHQITLEASQQDQEIMTLNFQPDSIQSGGILPVIDQSEVERMPAFQQLSEGEIAYERIKKPIPHSFQILVTKPGLYCIESTGLMRLQGTLRTRLNPDLKSESENGPGGNFMIQQFLNPGEYQVTLRPINNSGGYAGLKFYKTTLVEAGKLSAGSPGRITLRPTEAAMYHFAVEEEGEYHVKSSGLKQTFNCRIEDRDGWPVTVPGNLADVNLNLLNGEYRFISLPVTVESRRITELSFDKKTEPFTGHGPYVLDFNRPHEAVWRESEPDRNPDLWEFQVLAESDFILNITGEMSGFLRHSGNESGMEIPKEPLADQSRFHLDPGNYQLAVQCKRKNDMVMYTISLDPVDLIPGSTQVVDAPAEILLHVGSGEDGTSSVEIFSTGWNDVRASIYDLTGRHIISNDDRPDDWNFLLKTELTSGTYRLAVNPCGSVNAQCTVSMVKSVVISDRMALNEEKIITPKDKEYSLEISNSERSSGLFVFIAESDENISCRLKGRSNALNRQQGLAFGQKVVLAVPISSEEKLNVLISSLDDRGMDIHCRSRLVAAPERSEGNFKKGCSWVPVELGSETFGVCRVKLNYPGTFAVSEQDSGIVRWADRIGTECTAMEKNQIGTSGSEIWFIKSDGYDGKIAGERLVLNAEELHVPVGKDAPVVMDADESGLIIASCSAMNGQPGIMFETKDHLSNIKLDARGMAASEGKVLAVSYGNTGASILAWSAAPENPKVLDLRVTTRNLKLPPVQRKTFGELQVDIEPGSAQAFELPVGTKNILISGTRGAVGILVKDGRSQIVLWKPDTAFSSSLVSSADVLVLVAPEKESGAFSVRITSTETGLDSYYLTLQKPFETFFSTADDTYLDLQSMDHAEKWNIKVLGAITNAWFLGESGLVVHGNNIPWDGKPGYVRLIHQPGPACCWIDSMTTPGNNLWGSEKAVAMTTLQLPATLPLNPNSNDFAIDEGKPILISLMTNCPGIAKIKTEHSEAVKVFTQGCALNTLLPEGKGEISLRGIGTMALFGEVIITSREIIPINGSMSEKTCLGPGSEVLYVLNLTESQEIGIGIRTSSLAVSAKLQDEQGVTLGSGLIQMHKLAAGNYLIALELPQDAETAEVHVVITGLNPPGPGVPEEVKQQYMMSMQGDR